jgi:formylglycine-generating enzyme required for sulfatase activity
MMKMKNLFWGIFIASLLLGCMLRKHQCDEVRKQPKEKLIPPGTVWLRDSLFMDQMEITNLQYLEFLYWIRRQQPERYDSLLPDTLVDRHKLVYSEPYIPYYLRHPAYRNYPVIGVSYTQAVEFCKWRSDRVNQYLYVKKYIGLKNWKPDSIYVCPELVRYRLPTKEEWEYAASAGLDYSHFPLGYENLIDKDSIPVSLTQEYPSMKVNYFLSKKHKYKLNWRKKIPLDASDKPSPVDWGKPNCFGIYNMLGNVSEIIDDTLIKGLNYDADLSGVTTRFTPDEYVIVDSTGNGYDYKYTFHYEKPEAWLGFRCVCDILKTK